MQHMQDANNSPAEKCVWMR